LMREAKEAQIAIKLVPLEHADATSVANTLTQVFTRIQVGATSNTAIQQRPQTPQTPFQALFGGGQSQQQQASVLLLLLTRYNAILVAVPEVRFPDILAEIKKLDKAETTSHATPFALKKASASTVAYQIQQLWAQRYPGDQNHVRAW